ncbi:MULTISPECIES: DUF4168 domain-containing protein [Halomonas]|uniref:DUF4168 domain-containing protein n=1 Tax=Halomonas halophila TaxID=29573 RepID=A0ABQ0U2S1_9GAMM|nr:MULTISPECIES: DUF4168 domain-containing protein [Halomonas]PSJ23227.1 DUF4168 domain-containing protein [Halomonas sp. ND22Bw]MDR5890151.1 DUF4168 domain-containing protein [Halomonas salina]RAH37937.1 DUF4168 domain-containing protein [Halomonas sp. SL1]WJY06589.1 DUF4168 domain-containing protein [Halomonas halophila]GEK72776.1 hypothetical protein HHA04nite_13200 [Halomonas halophila]
MQRITALFSAALLSAGMMSSMAYAQDSADATASQGQAPAEAQAATQNFSDAQLQKFADASEEIAVISQDYTQQLQNAEGEEAQQQVRQEANDQMVEAVQNSGLEVETFNAIGQAIQQDPELMQRVQGMAQGSGESAS